MLDYRHGYRQKNVFVNILPEAACGTCTCGSRRQVTAICEPGFNADKTEEVIFSWKHAKPYHPILQLGSGEIKTRSEHKHLGIILDNKLHFKSHIREAILKARRGIGFDKISFEVCC